MNSIFNELMLFGQNGAAELADKSEKAAKIVPLHQNTYVLLAAAALALLVSVYIGYLISKAMRDSDYVWRGTLVAFSVLISGIIIVGNWPPRLGVDLKGGTTFIAQIQPSEDGSNDVTVEQVVTQLKSRVDPSGVYEIVLRPLGKDKIEIIIPDVNNEEAERIWQRVIQTGFLEFLIVSDNQFRPHQNVQNLAREQAIAPLKNQRRDEVYELVETESDSRAKGAVVGRWVEVGRVQTDSDEVKDDSDVVPYKMAPDQNSLIRNQRDGRIIEWADAFQNGLDLFSVADPNDRGKVLARWAASKGYDQLEILMMYSPDKEDDAGNLRKRNVTGEHVFSTSVANDSLGRPSVSFNMTSEGSKLLGKLTRDNRPDENATPPTKKQLGIVLDDALLSAPTINGVIRSNGVIEGDFTQPEVQDLVAILKAGRLKAAIAPTPVAQDKVESSIGREMKERGLFAISISFAAVLVFMMIYYRFSGVVACLALLANIVLIVALIMSIRFPFSLTGLAGLVLTVGMSVDANVLIFERMREEIDKGATLRMAIRNGFAKATTTIVDANLTTLITAIILYVIGSEQIKGFAVSLILGILMSMFTAIFCSRIIFDLAERKRWITKLSMMRFVGTSKFDFINMRTVCGFMSVALIAVGLCALFARGSNILAHDMAGGTTARIVFAEPPAGGADYVRDELTKAVEAKYGTEDKHEVEVAQVESWNTADEEFAPGTIFKVNTDLKLEEDTREVITELCTAAFPGQLSSRGLDYQSNFDENGGQAEDSTGDDSAESDTEEADTEEPADEETDDEPADDEEESEESTCGPQEDETEVSEEEESDSDTESTDDTDGDTDDIDAEKSDSSTEEADASEGSDAETADAEKTAEVETSISGWEPFIASADLKFKFPVGAEGVANTLRESTEGNIRLETDPRNYIAEGFDGIDLTYASTDWKVTFQTNDAADAEAVLTAAKSKLDGKPYFQSLSGVGGAIAGQTQIQALAAIIASLIGIIVYIWIRFQKLSFGLAAVVALIHDVLVVLGAIALSKWLNIIPGIDEFKISLPVIAAFMTIIGYSLNDTIVVFDRIRETRGKNPDLTKDMINRSIGQTLSRTVLTSVTTFLVVFILFAIGGETIHGFAFALVIGVIVGTYSSIFVASPVLYWLMGRVGDEPKPAIAKPGGQS